jgi:hypothetical protein
MFALSAVVLKKKKVLERIVTKFGRRGVGVSHTDARKKVPERRFGLRPSGKEFLVWHYGMFHHKNTPGSEEYLDLRRMK